MKEEEPNIYFIPQNYEDTLMTSSGIKMRNIIEGVVLLALIGIPLWFLPIESVKIRIVLIMFLGGGAGVFGVMGIHHYSLSEFFMLFIKFKTNSQDFEKSKIFENNEEMNEKTEYNNEEVNDNESE